MIADLSARLSPDDRRFVSRVVASCPCVEIPVGKSRAADAFESSGLLVVEHGTVALVVKARTGRRMLVAIVVQGQLLCAPQGEQRLRAVEDARVIAVTAEARRHLLARPSVAEAILDAVLEGLHEREESLAQFGSVAHLERVRRKLLQLARLHGKRVNGGVRVDVPLTHALIAEMIGSARETVSGAVSTLEREGFLSRDGSRYTVLLEPAELVASTPKPCEAAHNPGFPARDSVTPRGQPRRSSDD